MKSASAPSGTAVALAIIDSLELNLFEDIPELKLPKQMLDPTTRIVNTKSGHFDPSHFEQRYENASLACSKPGRRVVNVMDAASAPDF